MRYAILITIFLYQISSWSQIQWSHFDNPTIYKKENGLPSGITHGIIEDRQGFLWIGTGDGLTIFDGSSFINRRYFYQKGEQKEIGDVWALTFDEEEEYIFLGTNKGVLASRVDTIYFQPLSQLFPFSPDLNSKVNALYFDGNRTLWIGAKPDGLYKVDFNRTISEQFLFTQEGLTNRELFWHNSINHIVKDQDYPNTFWLGTDQGLVEFNTYSGSYIFHYYDQNKDLYHNIINEIVPTKTQVFAGSNYKGWFILDRTSKKTRQIVPDSDPSVFFTVTGLYLDSSKMLWISSPQGIKQYDTTAESVVDYLLNDRQINSVKGITYVDSRGIIWFCDNEGLIKYNPNDYHKYLALEKRAALEHPIQIKQIIPLNNHYYICANFSSGIYKMNSMDHSISTLSMPFTEFKPPGSNYLFKDMIAMNNNKLLVLGYQDARILDINTEIASIPLKEAPENPSRFFHKVVRDSAHNYYFTTNEDGLYKINYHTASFEKIKEAFKGKNSRDHNMLKALAIDSRNNLWIGQAATSVLNLETGDLSCLNPDLDYPDDLEFGNFLETPDKRMWVGNAVNGLSYAFVNDFSKGLTKVLDRPLTGIYPYNDSLIWTVSQGKLGRFNINTEDHQIITISGQYHITGPIVQMDHGDFMIGVENGLLLYNPEKHSGFKELPQVYLQEIKANNEVAYSGTDLQLHHFTFSSGTKSLTARIGALGYQNADEITYQFKTGDTWIDLGSSREINLSNLGQGNFTLGIRAINGSRNISEPVLYTFHIQPHWYTSNLALFFYMLLFGGLLYSFYNFHLKRKLALAESLRIKELDEVKSKMYANISHEFRTPLTLVKGISNTLSKNVADKAHQGMLNAIEKSNDQLLNLVNQMLDLTSLDVNQMELHYKNADVIGFIKKVVDLYTSYSDSKLIQLDFHTEVESLKMDFDDDKLQKILNNLLSNALKFTSQHGRIEVFVTKRGTHLDIAVTDTGKGIEAEDLSSVFDRYYRTYDVSGRQGSGIGLALTKELVELLQGSISVKSEKGKGSTFLVRLPIRNEAPSETASFHLPFVNTDIWSIESENKTGKGVGQKTLLLVEDNKDIQLFISDLLSNEYNVVVASDGYQGLKNAHKKDIDLIISDIMMRRMDGFEFCKRIKSDLATSHIPFILLSAKTHTKDIQKGYDLGVDAYITKPFHPDELKSLMGNLLSKQQERQAYLLELLAIKKPEVENPGINRLDTDLINRLQKIILENTSKLSANDIARKLLISRTQLHRKVKSLTGKSLTQYANHIRIEKAKHLLQTSELQISEIAYSMGFESSSYFIRLFKKEVGLTPERFKKTVISH